MDDAGFEQLKSEVHRTLLSRMDLEKLATVDGAKARQAVTGLIHDILVSEKVLLNTTEKERLSADLVNEVFGLGPLEPLLKDLTISDILVNRHDTAYIERNGILQKVDIRFRDDSHLLQIIDRIVARVGRRIDEASPMVDARLPDGSRVNAIIPPLALDGPALSIRRFGTAPISAQQMLDFKTLSPEMLEVLSAAVRARISVLISGGTGAGKTTFLNMLSAYIPSTERLVTIEDAAELQMQQENVVRLETRPPNVEGRGAIYQRQLVINSLRMRPDRIIVGEVRGDEAFDMLQAMNTGHEGSMTTIHANTCRDALARLESMVAMANLNLPDRAVRQQIAAGIGIIIQIARLSDGSRRVTNIAEITGMDEDVVSMQDIFTFVRKGIGTDGRMVGVFQPSRIRPRFMERLRVCGIILPQETFERTMEVA
jgi:pilus assembly protein CpaF